MREAAKMAIRQDGGHLVANICWQMAPAGSTANKSRTMVENHRGGMAKMPQKMGSSRITDEDGG